MKLLKSIIVTFLILVLLMPSVVFAQNLKFEMPNQSVDYYINSDGTATIVFIFEFLNSLFGAPIDYIDVGLPNGEFDVSSITADVNGLPITNISESDYQGKGDFGVALGLGSNAIQPGSSGTVTMRVNTIGRVLFPDTEDPEYTSTNYSTNYFGSEFVEGTSNMTVTFHFPEGVQPEEPRWHQSPNGWPAEPETGFDENGRIVYTWTNQNAAIDRPYEFGASFPSSYVPQETISKPTVSEAVEDSFGIPTDSIISMMMCCGGIGFVGLISFASYSSTRKRRLQYLPPKVSVEGHGIKRGLTAVEAAILLEQPLDKIMTMVLFSVIKKGAATVTEKDPLELDITEPLPENLRPYEQEFLSAFKEKNKLARKKNLQVMVVNLVKSVSNDMKGFNHRESTAYYEDIMKRAWAQVEAAETPEIKMEKFSENIEWTMLDQHYDDRTREVFQPGPIFAPTWWHRYDPTFSRPAGGGSPVSLPNSTSGGGGGFTAPTLPGSAFAASMI